MRAKRNVKSTVRMTDQDSAIFDRAAEQFGISKSEFLVRSARFIVANRTDENEFIAPEFTVRAVLKRFTDLIEQRAEERASETLSTASEDVLPELNLLATAKRYFNNLEAAKVE